MEPIAGDRRIELLALPNSHKKSLVRIIPEPKYELPEFFPPGYDSIPLNQKAPALRLPQNVKAHFRRRIGHALFKKKTTQFDLTDPYMHNVTYEYNSLHDPGLRRHFERPSINQQLIQTGLLGKNGEVYCPLKDYNDYRRYLYDCHIDKVNEVRARIDEKERDLRDVKYSISISARGGSKARGDKIRDRRDQQQCDAQARRRNQLRAAEFKRHEAARRAMVFNQMKSIKTHEILENRVQQNLENRFEIERNAVHRKLLIQRNSMLKPKLARARQHQANLLNLAAKCQRETIRRSQQFAWLEEKEKYTQTLVVLNEEIMAKNVRARAEQVAKCQEKFEQKITSKKAQLFKKCYEPAAIDDLVSKMMKELKRMFGDQDLKKNAPSCRGLIDTPTVLELLDEKTVRRAIMNTYHNAEQLRIPITTMNIIEDSVKSLRRIAAGHGGTVLPQDDMVANFIRRKVIKIIEANKNDFEQKMLLHYLNDPADGANERQPPGSMNNLLIQSAPDMATDIIHGVIDRAVAQLNGGNQNTASVVPAAQATNGIEKNGGRRYSCIKKHKSAASSQVSILDHHARSVSFVVRPEILPDSELNSDNLKTDTPFEEMICSRGDFGHTPPASISKMIRLALLKEHEEQSAPDDMNVDDMIHFHDYQKVIVNENLNRFDNYYKLKLDQSLNKYNLIEKTYVPLHSQETVNVALDQMVKSILTYPDEATDFGRNVWMISKITWSRIVNFIEFEFDSK